MPLHPRRPHSLLHLALLVLVCMSLASRLFSNMASAATSAVKRNNALVLPALTKPTATLIFSHGLGDSARGGWSEVVPEFQARFPFMKVILPQAPTVPVTANGGMRMPAWWDIKKFDNIANEDFEGIDQSLATITAMIDEEVAAGIPANRIVLGGFSQGAALSLYAGAQYKERLGGIAVLSGFLPHSKGLFHTLAHESNLETPIAFFHGDADGIVRHSIGKMSYDAVVKAGMKNVSFKTYQRMGHHSCDEEMRDLAAFFEKIWGEE